MQYYEDQKMSQQCEGGMLLQKLHTKLETSPRSPCAYSQYFQSTRV